MDMLVDSDRELLDVLFDRMPMGLAVFDRDLVLQRCNAAWAGFVGNHGAMPADEVAPGRHVFEYFPGAESELAPVFARVLAGKTRRFESVPHLTDGVTTYWDLLITPLWKDGEVIGLVDAVTDVTDRQRAEDDLRRSERRFGSLVRNSSDITIVVRPDGRLRYASPSVARILGVPPGGNVVGHDVMAPVHPGDRDRVRAALAKTAGQPGEGPTIECRLRAADGSWRTFEAVTVNLTNDPDVGGIVLNARDVSARREAEDDLRRRDAILEAVRFVAHRLLESHTSWEESIDEVMEHLGRAAQVSRAYIFENESDDDGTLWTTQTHEWVASGVTSQIDNPNMIRMAFDGGGFDRAAETMRRGEIIADNVRDRPARERSELEAQGILSLVMVPIFVDGRFWGFVGFDECLRERRWSPAEIDALQAAASTLSAAIQRQHAEEQLRDQEAQYRQVFEATGDGLLIMELDGTLVEANPAFHRMHGYAPGDLTGRRAETWIHADYHPARDDAFARVAAGGTFRGPSVDVRRDGTTFPVHVDGSAFTFRGQRHVLGVVRDDTERAAAFDLLARRINALTRIAASLTVSQSLPATLETVARSVIEATPAMASSVQLVDPATGALRTFVGEGLPPGYAEALEEAYRSGDAATIVRALYERKICIERNAVRHARQNPALASFRHLLDQIEWDTFVAVPLDADGRSMGVVHAYYRREDEPSDDEIAFLRAVADQAAVAVDNARLLAEAQSRAGLEERQRLARELHDSVSQALYGIALGARTARTLADRDPGQVVEPLDYVLSLAEAGLTEMRSLIFELRPESLASEGLVAALDKQLAVLRSRHQVSVEANLGPEPELPLPVKEAVYRIGQEALHNTIKHARAGQVRCRLGRAGADVVLEISDDGVGFDPEAIPPGHIGLASMQERAAQHGGEVVVESTPGAGTVVRARIPA